MDLILLGSPNRILAFLEKLETAVRERVEVRRHAESQSTQILWSSAEAETNAELTLPGLLGNTIGQQLAVVEDSIVPSSPQKFPCFA